MLYPCQARCHPGRVCVERVSLQLSEVLSLTPSGESSLMLPFPCRPAARTSRVYSGVEQNRKLGRSGVEDILLGWCSCYMRSMLHLLKHVH